MDSSYFTDILNQVKSYISKGVDTKPTALAAKPSKDSAPLTGDKATQDFLLGPAGPFQAPVNSAHNSGDYDPTGNGNVGRVHKGLDMRAPGGTAMFPIAAGIVKKVAPDTLGGNTVVIEHPGNLKSYYAHCGTVLVKPGDKVDLKTQIATVGDSGSARGFPHLHLQVWKDGSLIDPRSIFSFEKQTVFNKKEEKLWEPGAREVAKNFKIDNTKPTATERVASRQYLINRIELYAAVCRD